MAAESGRPARVQAEYPELNRLLEASEAAMEGYGLGECGSVPA